MHCTYANKLASSPCMTLIVLLSLYCMVIDNNFIWRQAKLMFYIKQENYNIDAYYTSPRCLFMLLPICCHISFPVLKGIVAPDFIGPFLVCMQRS